MKGHSTWKVNCAIIICIHLIDHILQLGLAWILAQGTHHCAQLFRCDLALTETSAPYTLSRERWFQFLKARHTIAIFVLDEAYQQIAGRVRH